MEFTAKQIADFIGGRVEGDENAAVSTFAKIEEGKKGAISFLSNPKYTHFVYETESSVVLVNDDLELGAGVKPTLIRVKNAYEAVAKLLQLYESMKPKKTGIDPLAFVSPKAQVGKDVFIGAFACIGDGAVIGDGSQVYPHAVIGDGVRRLSHLSECDHLPGMPVGQSRDHPCRQRDWCRRLWLRTQRRRLREDTPDRHRHH